MNAATPDLSNWTDGIQTAWDAFSLNVALDCLYKYNLILIEGWQPKRKSPHLLFGGWYASALEQYHKLVAHGTTREEALLTVVHTALIETWEHELDDDGERVPGTGKPWESDHNLKNRGNLIRTIVWYLDQFRDDSLSTVVLPDGRPAVEYSFRFELTDDILWSGHIDRLVEYEGDVYVQDQKTTGTTITPKFFADFSPDVQMSGYAYAGQVIYNTPVKGVIIDAAQVAVGFSRFERGFTFRSRAQLEEWRRNTIAQIRHVQQATLAEDFPLNPTSCGKYNGCQFRHVCARSPEVRRNFLLSDFTQRPQWNPLTPR